MKRILFFLIFTLTAAASYAEPLSTQIRVTNVEINSKTAVRLYWEMVDVFASSTVVVETGSVSLQFIPFDAVDPDTKLPYTQDQRVDELKSQFVDFASNYISRYRGGLGDFPKYVQLLNGLTVEK